MSIDVALSPTTTPEQDVTQLMSAARNGEHQAWDQLIHRYNRLVLSTARRHGLDMQQCDDVAQVTWLRLFENIDLIRNDLALAGWLVTTTTRECYAVSRRYRREVPVESSILDRECTIVEDLDDHLDTQLRRGLLKQAVMSLPYRERCLIETLMQPEPPSYREISQRLGMPMGAIGPVRHRALDRLRRLLHTPNAASATTSTATLNGPTGRRLAA